MTKTEYLEMKRDLYKAEVELIEAMLENEKAEQAEQVKEKKPKRTKAEKATKKAEPEPETEQEEETTDYDNMTAQKLYKLCCERGISGKCKSRKKADLIALLKEYDGADPSTEDEDDDWGEDEEEEKNTSPYAGKSEKELYKMCKDRGINAKPKKSAEEYIKLLTEADEAENDTEEDDDDDWEI